MRIGAPGAMTDSGTLEKMMGASGTAPDAALGIEAAAGEFVGVLVIVLADAKDVAARPGQRCLKHDVRNIDRGGCGQGRVDLPIEQTEVRSKSIWRRGFDPAQIRRNAAHDHHFRRAIARQSHAASLF